MEYFNMTKFTKFPQGTGQQAPANAVKGATFKAASFFRPTGMSVAMAAAGIIPAAHLIRDFKSTGTLRHKNDVMGVRPSVQVAF